MKKFALYGAVAMVGALLLTAGTTAYKSRLIARSSSTNPTCATATGDGDICAEDAIEANGALDVGGASTLTGAVTASSTLSVTGLITGSGGLAVASPSILLEGIRFCGNGHDGSTAHYMGPVPLDDTEADLAVGGAGCDALDDPTIGNADAPWPRSPNVAFKPVAMVCNGLCTGATPANDPVVFALYDDTAAVAGMTCTFTLAGDATAGQCTVTDPTPATVAAGSAITVKVSGTDDVCDDAGDDFECIVFVTY